MVNSAVKSMGLAKGQGGISVWKDTLDFRGKALPEG
jgi:hypothetical protein